jgi:hypothetical protein
LSPARTCSAKSQDGSTVAGDYKSYNINLKPASTDRINGWAEVLKLLGDPDNGTKAEAFHSRAMHQDARNSSRHAARPEQA